MAVRLAGGNHVAISVRDLARSTEWYCRVLRLTVVSTHENIGPPYFADYAYNGLFDLATTSYVVALVQHPDPLPEAFDPRRLGLDHLGLQVPEREDLDDWVRHFDEEGVPHSGVVESPYAWVVNFRDPDGIQLELSVIRLDFWVGLLGELGAS